MDIKNIEQLTITTLNLLWDLNGHKTKQEVIELLVTQVFEKIEKENFQNICNQLQLNINNNPKCEIMVFEEALEIFLRKLFQLGA
ncbi:hypothetical protein N5U00_10600 [Aliarcobacter butzleri]|uniref:hypothetical protein n=1 Tax=Aliarcobacter butzleri TaxID=28197 RepID=UPI0021B2C711|nr:hypothetical protein [Aliarcobacter butzleri]MCT7570408.1 hypothetical protein [Aliarcobacter butzleri]MCT7572856.1 hypothetical protein [Aliarcobacter butzleri]MCT7575779.1 hypothetical protein [Aliarcobacter butzleri]MCT7579843.1 hypothetical protein [Aliarcobacter butzleri]